MAALERMPVYLGPSSIRVCSPPAETRSRPASEVYGTAKLASLGILLFSSSGVSLKRLY